MTQSPGLQDLVRKQRPYSFYHFHVEFYPPHRSRNKLKYLAGCESGAGTFINDTVPEDTARELRNIKL